MQRYDQLKKNKKNTRHKNDWKAREKSTGVFVTINQSTCQHDGIPAEKLRQIAILKRLAHPNIELLKDVFNHHGKVCLVFEFVPTDLKDFLDNQDGMIESKLIKSFTAQLLSGLDHCHSRGVMHRNIHPGNIRVSRDMQLKIGGFNHSRMFVPPIRKFTEETTVRWYRSPEILLGAEIYDLSVDLWALGCLLAEMATKEPLFPSDSDIDQLFKIFRLKGTPNELLWPGVTSLKFWNESFPMWLPVDLSKVVCDLDEIGVSLLEQLLELCPGKRATAEEALMHPFVTEPCTLSLKLADEQTIEDDDSGKEQGSKKSGGGCGLAEMVDGSQRHACHNALETIVASAHRRSLRLQGQVVCGASSACDTAVGCEAPIVSAATTKTDSAEQGRDTVRVGTGAVTTAVLPLEAVAAPHIGASAQIACQASAAFASTKTDISSIQLKVKRGALNDGESAPLRSGSSSSSANSRIGKDCVPVPSNSCDRSDDAAGAARSLLRQVLGRERAEEHGVAPLEGAVSVLERCLAEDEVMSDAAIKGFLNGQSAEIFMDVLKIFRTLTKGQRDDIARSVLVGHAARGGCGVSGSGDAVNSKIGDDECEKECEEVGEVLDDSDSNMEAKRSRGGSGAQVTFAPSVAGGGVRETSTEVTGLGANSQGLCRRPSSTANGANKKVKM